MFLKSNYSSGHFKNLFPRDMSFDLLAYLWSNVFMEQVGTGIESSSSSTCFLRVPDVPDQALCHFILTTWSTKSPLFIDDTNSSRSKVTHPGSQSHRTEIWFCALMAESDQLATMSLALAPEVVIGLSLAQPCQIQQLVSSDSVSPPSSEQGCYCILDFDCPKMEEGRGQTHIFSQAEQAWMDEASMAITLSC